MTNEFGSVVGAKCNVFFERKTFLEKTFPTGIEVCVHEKGWFDAEIMKDWIKTLGKTSRCSTETAIFIVTGRV